MDEKLIFVILVSHSYYGSCYVAGETLVKDRNEAQVFTGTWDESKTIERKYELKHKEDCYATFI